VVLVALFVRVRRRTRVRAAAVLARACGPRAPVHLLSAIGGGRFDTSGAERRGSASAGSASGVKDDAGIEPLRLQRTSAVHIDAHPPEGHRSAPVLHDRVQRCRPRPAHWPRRQRGHAPEKLIPEPLQAGNSGIASDRRGEESRSGIGLLRGKTASRVTSVSSGVHDTECRSRWRSQAVIVQIPPKSLLRAPEAEQQSSDSADSAVEVTKSRISRDGTMSVIRPVAES
jgi:hypothetical protein